MQQTNRHLAAHGNSGTPTSEVRAKCSTVAPRHHRIDAERGEQLHRCLHLVPTALVVDAGAVHQSADEGLVGHRQLVRDVAPDPLGLARRLGAAHRLDDQAGQALHHDRTEQLACRGRPRLGADRLHHGAERRQHRHVVVSGRPRCERRHAETVAGHRGHHRDVDEPQPRLPRSTQACPCRLSAAGAEIGVHRSIGNRVECLLGGDHGVGGRHQREHGVASTTASSGRPQRITPGGVGTSAGS